MADHDSPHGHGHGNYHGPTWTTRWHDGSEHQAFLLEERERDGRKEYYVHYQDVDRRMDGWIPAERIDFESGSQSPRGGGGSKKRRKLEAAGADVSTVVSTMTGTAGMDPTLMERLEAEREEITKVKNIPSIQFGRWDIEAWYYSPFPDMFSGHRLYICEYTLKYFLRASTLLKHKQECVARHPPGKRIYYDGKVSLWEVDGTEQKLYCENLCLLSKLFIEHKTLYFDVNPFLFYVLTEYQEDVNDTRAGGGEQLLGYFSKEKKSELDYNLACILTFPPYQRCGYGKLLISFSYELSKRDGMVGSPEKPLSDLGKLSYRSFWTFVLLTTLLDYDGKWTLRELSTKTGIKVEDVISTLQALDLIKYWKGQHIIFVSQTLLKELLAKLKPPRLCLPHGEWAEGLARVDNQG